MKPTRQQRLSARAIERRGMATGKWPAWELKTFPKGSVGPGHWTYEIDRAWTNGVYVCLVRRIDWTDEGRVHLAIRTASNQEPPWRDLQRIKNELFGPERVAAQVCPPASRLIDQADMYHLFVLPVGAELGFGLHPLDERPVVTRQEIAA